MLAMLLQRLILSIGLSDPYASWGKFVVYYQYYLHPVISSAVSI